MWRGTIPLRDTRNYTNVDIRLAQESLPMIRRLIMIAQKCLITAQITTAAALRTCYTSIKPRYTALRPQLKITLLESAIHRTPHHRVGWALT